MQRLVIVGASLGGLRAAQAARAAGFEGELVVVGEERHPPYTRPPLSKELLAGEHTVERVSLPTDKFEAEWRLGVPAASLDRERRRVVLADGDEVAYDRLILATGSRARRWPGTGAELEGVHVLRDLDDALALRAAFDGQPRVAIVGAGFIGCEVAQTARKLGLEVTLIDIAATPMLPLGPRARRAGAPSCTATTAWTCASGAESPGWSATGGWRRWSSPTARASPRTWWSPASARCRTRSGWPTSGLRLDPGLVCDATLTAAGDPDVLGAGDIVTWPHPLADGEAIRIEHWTVAAEQGQLAGRNALAGAGRAQALRRAAVLLVGPVRREDPVARPAGPSRPAGAHRVLARRAAARVRRRARRAPGRRGRAQRREAPGRVPHGARRPAARSTSCARASAADPGALGGRRPAGRVQPAGRTASTWRPASTSGATRRCASSKPEPTIEPPAARAAMPWQTTASLKKREGLVPADVGDVEAGAARVALDDLGARGEARRPP